MAHDPISPEIHVLLRREVTLLPLLQFALPFLLEREHDAGREVGGIGANQGFESFAHVRGGDTLQVESGDEGVDRRGAAQIGRQDLGPKLQAVLGVFAGAGRRRVLLDVWWSRAGKHGPFGEVAAAHDAVAACFVAQVLELGKGCIHFELKGPLEELSCTITDEFIERRQWTDGLRIRSVGHGAYLLLEL